MQTLGSLVRLLEKIYRVLTAPHCNWKKWLKKKLKRILKQPPDLMKSWPLFSFFLCCSFILKCCTEILFDIWMHSSSTGARGREPSQHQCLHLPQVRPLHPGWELLLSDTTGPEPSTGSGKVNPGEFLTIGKWFPAWYYIHFVPVEYLKSKTINLSAALSI